MCGIVGIFIKNKKLESKLGGYLSIMIDNMSSRGPDSAGFAIYDSPNHKKYKFSLCIPNKINLNSFKKEINNKFKDLKFKAIADHLIVTTSSKPNIFTKFIEKNYSNISIVGFGKSIEIFKQVGSPRDIVKKFKLENFKGSHGIGHTRMATESAITTNGSHPYSTGEDECLVHNGSLSNHNNLRRDLIKKGKKFDSFNDTEVAAGYISYQLSQGKSLKNTLTQSLKDLDGFYTFIVGTKNGFAVLRDEIACKPAVIAETKDYVAIASEFQAMAHLPNVIKANIFEPEPGKIYTWEKK
jgi:glutamate synthase domain-containing protein 1